MPRGHWLYFYAIKGDYEPVIADVAALLAVKYTVDEWRVKPDFRVYQSPLDAPGFDLFKWPRSPGTIFFVLPEDAELPFKHMPDRQVPEKYGFFFSGSGEIPNYRWVQFRPIGFHKSEPVGAGLLEGWLATNSEHPDSLAIFNAFKMSIKKRFEYFRYSGGLRWPRNREIFRVGRTAIGLGREVSRPMVRRCHALAHRADGPRPATEEIRPHDARPPGTSAQLLPGTKGVLQRCYRGAQQQS